MATNNKAVRYADTKAALLRLAKSVGAAFVTGVTLMITTGSATVLTIVATCVAGASFAALVYAAKRLDD